MGFHKFGVRVKTLYQRKSGDVFTFMGNTVTAMAVLAYTYSLDESLVGVFGGDDSLIIFPEEAPLPDNTQRIAEYFNLEAKIETFPDALYFSSRYLIFAQGRWLFVPDPVKAVFRLGRNNVYCKKHAELMHVSFKDNFKYYRSQEVRTKVAKAARARWGHIWKCNSDVSLFSEFIANLVEDEENFLRLYEDEPEIWLRKMLPDLQQRMEKHEFRVTEFTEEMNEYILA